MAMNIVVLFVQYAHPQRALAGRGEIYRVATWAGKRRDEKFTNNNNIEIVRGKLNTIARQSGKRGITNASMG